MRRGVMGASLAGLGWVGLIAAELCLSSHALLCVRLCLCLPMSVSEPFIYLSMLAKSSYIAYIATYFRRYYRLRSCRSFFCKLLKALTYCRSTKSLSCLYIISRRWQHRKNTGVRHSYLCCRLDRPGYI